MRTNNKLNPYRVTLSTIFLKFKGCIQKAIFRNRIAAFFKHSKRYAFTCKRSCFLNNGLTLFPGERRIRVHTLALPITNKLADLYATADVQAIATLLTKMGKLIMLHLTRSA